MLLRSSRNLVLNSIFNISRNSSTSTTSNLINGHELILKQFGEPNDQSLECKNIELTIESLKDDQVCIELLGATINPADLNIIQGKYATLPQLPSIIGNEGVYKVIASSNDNKLKIGDWVIPATTNWGSWRTHSIESIDNFIKLPSNMTNKLNGLLINPCTAYRMLKDFVDLKPNDTIIQNGANSAVGQAVIQMAKSMNVNVINIIRKKDKTKDQNEDEVIYLKLILTF
jgi:mitochondrial enoyl-[acyl-carrier protein] reductase / trans-2-enoyl-CoA reductase